METETAPLEASLPQCHPNPDTPPKRPKLSLFDDPDVDIVIQSCDLREFRVLKLDVIRNSPVLGDLIQSATIDSSGSSTSTHASGLPCVRLPENRGILSSLLSFILPVPPILPPTAEKIMKLLSVAQKYQMTRALAHIRGAVASQDSPFIRPETVFHIFSLAQKYGLGQEVARAARIALTFPMTIEDLEDKLDTIHGAHLHILWKYYQSIRISLSSDLLARLGLIAVALARLSRAQAFQKLSRGLPPGFQWLRLASALGPRLHTFRQIVSMIQDISKQIAMERVQSFRVCSVARCRAGCRGERAIVGWSVTIVDA
ncbi:hypothetical protein EDB83DRAFT_2658175 [Lactarius deliciosus]|nr:hypothetical protein EDB83DRAFT_2658175 [Lactarius deliciosus]